MNIVESFWQAITGITTNLTRSFLTMLGVIIGVFSIISLITLGEGAKEYVNREFASIGTKILIVARGGPQTSGMPSFADTAQKLTQADAEAIKKRCPSIEKVAPLVFSNVNIKYRNKERVNAPVIGTEGDFHAIRNVRVGMGQELPKGGSRSERHICVIGQKIRKELFGKESNPLGKTIKIADRTFRVIGVLEAKGVQLGFNLDDLVLVPVKAAQEITDSDDLIEILTQLKSTDVTQQAVHEVKQLMLKRHNGYEDFTVVTQSQMMGAFQNIISVLTIAVTAIGAISLIVGGIGIMNIMLVSVGEKTREIGIRKAIGAKNSDILLQFLIESASISTLGGIVGMSLSLLCFVFLQKFYPKFPLVIHTWVILLGIGFSALIGIFFGVYPARKAARLDPLAALRYD